ncbi:MAG: hypothetical protein IKH78_09150 [Ruminococcus sp.]|nr:hypothetical protein [Ruminococcus sp.]
MSSRILCGAAAALVLLTGCSSGRIHERSYLRAAAFSGSSLTLSFFEEEDCLSAEGENIRSALENAELKNGREIFTGFTELAVIGDGDVRGLLNSLLNEWKVSPSCMIVYSSDGGSLLAEAGAERLRGMAEQAVKQGIAPECDIITLLSRLCAGEPAETAELFADGTAARKRINQF